MKNGTPSFQCAHLNGSTHFFFFFFLSEFPQVLTPSSGFLDFAISMRPDYHEAIIDTIRHYQWEKIIYLYDSHDGKGSIYIDLIKYLQSFKT